MPLEFEDALPDDEIYQDNRVTVTTKPQPRPAREFVNIMTPEDIEEEARIRAEIRAKYKKDHK